MNMEELIIAKLEKLGKKYKKSGDHYIISQCLNPKHNDSHPSFSINLETGVGFCFTCEYKVNKNFWIDENADNYDELIRESQYNQIKRRLKKDEKNEYKFILPPKNAEVPDGWRGLKKEIIEKYQLYITHYGLYKNRVIFPFYEGEKLVGFNSRALYPDMQPKYLYAKNIDLKSIVYPDFGYSDTIVVVEGVMDALSLIQDGIPAIANLGLALNFNENKIEKLLRKGVTKIYLMFDNDKAGKEAYKKFFQSNLKEFFDLDYGYKHKKLKNFYSSNYKDYNDYLQSRK
jgi:DNA primase